MPVRTWWARPSELEDREDRLALLTTAERARWARFRQPADQDRFLAAWSLTRTVLGGLTGVPAARVAVERACGHCAHPDHGKPRLVGGGLDFSLSHAGDRVLLAVTGAGSVGADVEQTSRPADDVARLVLHPSEPPARGVDLLRVWVRKEAVLKATGHGLAEPMAGFAVSPGDAPPRLLTWPRDPSLPSRTTLTDLPADDGYLASITLIR